MTLNQAMVVSIIRSELKRLDKTINMFDRFDVAFTNNREITIEGWLGYDRVRNRCNLTEITPNTTMPELKKYLELQAYMAYQELVRTGKYCLYRFTPHVQNPLMEKSVKPTIERVVFNDPATIVFWKDGTKTVVKCSKGDTFSKESGIAMCFMKKMHGNGNEYHKIFKEHAK